MRWIGRTNRRWSTWLALAAMALQLVLSFGHIHLEKLASGSVIASLATSKAPSSQQIPTQHPANEAKIFARSARRSISPRRHSCRMRRSCRCRSRPEQSSILALSISFLSRRNARHFNRERLRWPDSRSLLFCGALGDGTQIKRGNPTIFDLPRQRDPRLSRPSGHSLQQSGTSFDVCPYLSRLSARRFDHRCGARLSGVAAQTQLVTAPKEKE